MLELYDPLTNDETLVAGRAVPLESDLTTPLAYFLSRPEMNLDTSTARAAASRRVAEDRLPTPGWTRSR